jgi:hypothetical protein
MFCFLPTFFHMRQFNFFCAHSNNNNINKIVYFQPIAQDELLVQFV